MLTTTLLNTTVLFVVFMIVITTLLLLSNFLGLSSLTVFFSSVESRRSCHRILLAILCCGAVFGITSRMYLSYLAPGDILQNTISAEEFAHGRSLYPSDLNRLVRNALRERPPHEPLSDRLAILKKVQTDQFAASYLNIVNAHPPLFSVVIAPLVKAFGIYIPALGVNAIALFVYGYVVWCLRSILFPHFSPLLQAVFLSLCFGWQPVLASIRHANQSLVVSSLVILCWYLLRRKRDLLSGFVLGVAIALKVYPCILLGYLIIRRLRAFAAALVTTVALTLFVWFFVGTDDLLSFARTARIVTNAFGVARNNISVLSVVSGTVSPVGPPSVVAVTVYFLITLMGVGGLMCFVFLSKDYPANRAEHDDIECAMFVCLMCLFSPIVWPHYFSLMLLPLAIIARYGVDWLQSRSDKIAFFLIALVLSLPDQPLQVLSEILRAQLGPRLGWLLGSLQTFAVLATVVWLVILRIVSKPAPKPEFETARYAELSVE